MNHHESMSTGNGQDLQLCPMSHRRLGDEELLNELRSLQISDKAFQDVVKLPSLEVRREGFTSGTRLVMHSLV